MWLFKLINYCDNISFLGEFTVTLKWLLSFMNRTDVCLYIVFSRDIFVTNVTFESLCFLINWFNVSFLIFLNEISNVEFNMQIVCRICSFVQNPPSGLFIHQHFTTLKRNGDGFHCIAQWWILHDCSLDSSICHTKMAFFLHELIRCVPLDCFS